MTPEEKCPRCNASLPPGGDSETSCPRCLLQAGLGGADSMERDARASAPSPEDLSRHFPDLEVLELVGSGGMGLVYKARQRRLDRIVALKVLAPDVAGEEGFAERFQREARALAKLAHPNIVGIYDFGEAGGMFYFMMEFVEGVNLRQLQQTEKLSPKQALAIVPKICDALQYAHDKGVVHRDIKPENVLMTAAGEIKIADFGVAKLMRTGGNVTLTADHKVMGTPAYMAPEQIEQPANVDHRADVFSLGVVFYEMLTGDLPMGRFDPPSHKVEIDVRLDDVVLRSLERERSQRYQRIDDVKTGIHTIVSSAPESKSKWKRAKMPGPDGARPQPRPRTPRRPLSRHTRSAGWWHALAVMLLGLVGLILAVRMPTSTFTMQELFASRGIVTFAFLMLVVGFALAGTVRGVMGWVETVGSEGKLRGLWFAVLSALLVPAMAVLWLLVS